MKSTLLSSIIIALAFWIALGCFAYNITKALIDYARQPAIPPSYEEFDK